MFPGFSGFPAKILATCFFLRILMRHLFQMAQALWPCQTKCLLRTHLQLWNNGTWWHIPLEMLRTRMRSWQMWSTTRSKAKKELDIMLMSVTWFFCYYLAVMWFNVGCSPWEVMVVPGSIFKRCIRIKLSVMSSMFGWRLRLGWIRPSCMLGSFKIFQRPSQRRRAVMHLCVYHCSCSPFLMMLGWQGRRSWKRLVFFFTFCVPMGLKLWMNLSKFVFQHLVSSADLGCPWLSISKN